MDATAATTLFAWLDPEMWLVTAQGGGRRSGLLAPLVSQASAVPEIPRVLVGLPKHHATWELVQASEAFALHLLAEEDVELVWQFWLEGAADHDPFAGLKLSTAVTGSPVLERTIGWLDCRVETSLDIGDRTLFVAEVVEGKVLNFAPPLTWQRLLERAPSGRLVQLQRQRHLESCEEMEAIRLWREGRQK